MPEHLRWVDRHFNFDFPAGCYREIMERLRGTPTRVEDLVGSFPPEILTVQERDRWSIQENVGHLVDLEELFMGRLDDYDAGAETLRGADMSNRKTHEANHNERAIESLFQALRVERGKLVQRLESLEPARYEQTALHPRLEVPMRIVDMMYFQAEHDDFHLARITELARTLMQQSLS